MGDRDENVTWNHSANILIDVGELIAAGQLTGLLPEQESPAAINTPTSINIFHDSRSHFDPGPPSNVNTVLYNGEAPIIYNV